MLVSILEFNAGVAEWFRRQPAELLYMGSIPIPSSTYQILFLATFLLDPINYTILVIPMSMEETVCAKVPAELKKKLSSLGVNTSQVIRESLQAEVDRLEKERLNKLAKEVSVILKKIPSEEFAQSIRATKESR